MHDINNNNNNKLIYLEYTENCQPAYGPGFTEGAEEGEGEQDCQTIPVNNCR